MWQDHLVSVSKLFVEHTKLFMIKNGIKADANNGMCKSATSPRIKNLDNCDSDTEGLLSHFISHALFTHF